MKKKKKVTNPSAGTKEKDEVQQGNDKPKDEKDQQDNGKLQIRQCSEKFDLLQQDNEKLKEEMKSLQEDGQKYEQLKNEQEKLQRENEKLKEEMKSLQEDGQKYEQLKKDHQQLHLENEKLKEEMKQLEVGQKHEQLKRQRESKQQESEEKYEQLLSHVLARDREGQEVLSDPLRPSEVAERWRTFKDQVYFNTYQDMEAQVKDKQQRRGILKDICQIIYEHHRKKEDAVEKVFQDQLLPFFQGKDTEKDLAKAFQKVVTEMKKSSLFKLSSKEVGEVEKEAVEIYRRSRTFLADMQTQVLAAVKSRWKKTESQGTPEPNVQELFPMKSPLLQHSATCRDYVTQCHALCRQMMLQLPSMHLTFDATPGSKFNRGHFDVHDGPDAGEITVEQLVLPALLRSQGGKVMEKGLATVRCS